MRVAFVIALFSLLLVSVSYANNQTTNTTVTLYGSCFLKDSYASLSNYDGAVSGTGFAKTNLGVVADFADAKSKCTNSVYDSLMNTYCSSGSNQVQWGVITYSYSDGVYSWQTSGSPESGSDFHSCPTANPTPTPNNATNQTNQTVDPCIGVVCNSPPPSYCYNSYQLISYPAGVCTNGQCSYSTNPINCPYGCSNGACVQQQNNTSNNATNTTTPTCTDTDGGQNYYATGTVTANGQSYTDFCNDAGTLTEKYCGNGALQATTYNCPYGCSNGACSSTNTTVVQCTEGQVQTKVCTNGNSYVKYNCLNGKWNAINYFADPCGVNQCAAGQTQNGVCSDGRSYIKANCVDGKWFTVNYIADPCAVYNNTPKACPAGCECKYDTAGNPITTYCNPPVQSCNNNGICEVNEETTCKDCLSAKPDCPLTTKCTDGSTVACSSNGYSCVCGICPIPVNSIPVGCRQENNNGFITVVCDNYRPQCQSVNSDLSSRCTQKGGLPVVRKENGCEFFVCDFGGESGNIFAAPATCATPEEVSQAINKCSSIGLKGVISYENGCKIGKCVQEKQECPAISESDKNNMWQKCSAQGMRIGSSYDGNGCQQLTCKSTDYCQADPPKEAYAKCASEGGQLVVKKENNCVVFNKCVTRGDPTGTYSDGAVGVPDSGELLSIALKLENLKVQLDSMARKTADIAAYYKTTASPDEARYRRVSDMLTAASGKVDEIRTKIRQKISTMNMNDVSEIKRDIRYIKDVLIKDILYVMLSNGDDIDKLKNGTVVNCGNDENCFNDAMRICQPATFRPKDLDGILVEVRGLENNKCVMYAKLGTNDMTCKLEKYALGIMNPTTDIFPYCSGSLVQALKTISEQDSGTGTVPALDDDGSHPPITGVPSSVGGDAEVCSGCFDNGVCDKGECATCGDCGGISYEVRQQISGVEKEKASRTPAQLKIDSNLLYTLKQARGEVPTTLQTGITPDSNGMVGIEISANVTDSVIHGISDLGGSVTGSYPDHNSITAKFPLLKLEDLASLPDVTFIAPQQTGATNG